MTGTPTDKWQAMLGRRSESAAAFIRTAGGDPDDGTESRLHHMGNVGDKIRLLAVWTERGIEREQLIEDTPERIAAHAKAAA